MARVGATFIFGQLCAVLLLMAVPVGAVSPARARTSIDAATLSNGVTALIGEETRAPLAAIVVSFEVGSGDDPAAQPGLARLMGRLLLAASTRHLRAIDREPLIKAMGVDPWDVKVLVGVDRTQLQMLVPVRALELALWLESDRAFYFSDGIDAGTLRVALAELEREEQRASADKTELMRRSVRAGLFPADTPHGYEVDLPTLARSSAVELRARARSYYVPQRTTVTVIGNTSKSAVRAWCERYFGSAPKAQTLPVARPLPPPPLPAHRVELALDEKTNGVAFGWRTPRYLEKDDVALDAAARILMRRLSQRLLETRLATRLQARQSSHRLESEFAIAAAAAEGHGGDELGAAIREALDALREGKIDPKDLDSARRQLMLETSAEFDSLLGRAEYANVFFNTNHDANYYRKYRRAYQGLDAASVAKAAKDWLALPAGIELSVRPGQAPARARAATAMAATPVAQARAIPDAAFRYRPPPVVDEAGFSPPLADDVRLANGARLLFHARPGSERLLFRIVARFRDPPPCCGTYPALAYLIAESTRGNARSLRESVRDYGGLLSARADADSLDLSVSLLPEDLEAAATAMTEGLTLSRLEPSSFDQLLRDWQKAPPPEPRQVLNEVLARELFPAGHRYHRMFGGKRDPTLREIERYRSAQFRAASVSYVVAGDLSLDQARQALERASRSLPAGAAPRAGSVMLKPGVVLAADPKREATEVAVMVPVADWRDPEYGASLALRWFFGTDGRLRPNLAERLREAGVSRYDNVYANVVARADLAVLVVYVRVTEKDVAGAVGAVLAQMDKLGQGEISAAGVADARRELLSSIEQRYENTDATALELVTLAAFGPRTAADVDAVLYRRAALLGRDEIARAARRYLRKDRVSVVVYGRLGNAQAELEKIGLSVRSVSPGEAKP